MTFKLIALDVDGTLLNDQHELTEQTKQTVRAVHAAGARIVLCTGRGPASALPVMEQLGLSGTLVTHNGAATISSEHRSILHSYSFTREQVAPFIRYGREHQIHFDLNTAFDMYVEELSLLAEQMYTKFFMRPHQVIDLAELSKPFVKMTYFGTINELDQLELQADRFTSSLKMIRSGDDFIDVMHPQATKGSALRKLAEQMGISSDEVLAIGNYYNDLDMLEYAGLGIAMDNSPELVKQTANIVTSSNNEEGVHLALTQYCLKSVS